MKENSIIASRYAKALFEYAVEEKILERVNEDMKTVSQVCRQNKDFRLLLQSPVIRKEKKDSIIREVFKKHLSRETLTYLQIITQKSRESYIPEIAFHFTILYKEFNNIKTVHLKTASPVDEQLRNRIISIMARRTNARIELIEETDPSLIGGFVISMDDMQYDASIQRQLKELKREFDFNIYIKGF
jgi:F-type H+-transporting ATPase subunit delta